MVAVARGAQGRERAHANRNDAAVGRGNLLRRILYENRLRRGPGRPLGGWALSGFRQAARQHQSSKFSSSHYPIAMANLAKAYADARVTRGNAILFRASN